MSWLLKHNKKTNKWRIWTTIADGWISDWLSEKEIKKELSFHDSRDYRLKIIKTYWTFPDEWHDKDTREMYRNTEAVKQFYEWHLKILEHPETYDQEIDNKLKELGAKL